MDYKTMKETSDELNESAEEENDPYEEYREYISKEIKALQERR